MADDYVRLHITPLTQNLLTRILPPSILPNARNISYHEIQTFPERAYGYVELPTMDAEKIKKKLNGSILKGQKVQIETARPEKQPLESEEPKRKDKTKKRKRDEIPAVEIEERQVKRGWTVPSAKAKDKTVIKSKYTTGPECLFKTVLPTNVANGKDIKSKEKKGKKGKEVIIHEFSKSTKYATFLRTSSAGGTKKGVAEFVEGKGWLDEDGNVVEVVKESIWKAKEPLVKPQDPVEAMDISEESSGDESSDEEDSKICKATEAPGGTLKEGIVAEKQASDTTEDGSSSEETSSDEDSEDSDGEEGEKEGAAENEPREVETQHLKLAEAKKDTSDGSEESSEDSSSDSDSDSGSGSTPKPIQANAESSNTLDSDSDSDSDSSELDSELEAKVPQSKAAKRASPSTSESSSSESDSDSDSSSDSSKDNSPKEATPTRPQSSSSAPTNLSITIPPAISIHPLEALYKRKKQASPTSNPTSEVKESTFSFFGADEANSDVEEDAHDQPPLTPFTQRDFEYRGIRSAAPTPDTAHANKRFVWPTSDDVASSPSSSKERAAGKAKSMEKSSGTVGATADESEFQKWFYEHRGDANRAWKKRRKVVAKEKRQRENRKRKERI